MADVCSSVGFDLWRQMVRADATCRSGKDLVQVDCHWSSLGHYLRLASHHLDDNHPQHVRRAVTFLHEVESAREAQGGIHTRNRMKMLSNFVFCFCF